jgi:hypothetical protein
MTGMLVPAVLFSLAAVACSTAPVAAADYLDDGTGRVADACDSPAVLGFITSNFDYKANHYLKTDIAIAEIRDMHQKRVESRDETHLVQREYCRATATTTDGERRALWYLIERGWGFAGIGSNIEFCLSGLDPWYVYGAQCASLR